MFWKAVLSVCPRGPQFQNVEITGLSVLCGPVAQERHQKLVHCQQRHGDSHALHHRKSHTHLRGSVSVRVHVHALTNGICKNHNSRT